MNITIKKVENGYIIYVASNLSLLAGGFDKMLIANDESEVLLRVSELLMPSPTSVPN